MVSGEWRVESWRVMRSRSEGIRVDSVQLNNNSGLGMTLLMTPRPESWLELTKLVND